MTVRDRFDRYGADTWHCRTCHRLVDTVDANTSDDRDALLYAHITFNCRTDPGETL